MHDDAVDCLKADLEIRLVPKLFEKTPRAMIKAGTRRTNRSGSGEKQRAWTHIVARFWPMQHACTSAHRTRSLSSYHDMLALFL